MSRTLAKWTMGLVVATSLGGCVAGPQPMTVLMPTYSFHRDEIGADEDVTPIKPDVVAAAEP